MALSITSSDFHQTLVGTHAKIVSDNKLISQLYEGVPTWRYLTEVKNAKVLLDGGDHLRVNLFKTDFENGAWVDGYDTLPVAEEVNEIPALFEWAQRYDTLVVSDKLMALNAGDERIVDLAAERIRFMQESMGNKINRALHVPTTKAVLSLDTVISNTGTLGTIDRSTDTYWQSRVGTGAATGSMYAAMVNMHNQCWHNISPPDGILTSQILYEAFELTHFSKLQINDTASAKLGVTVFKFKNSDFFFDFDCPNSRMYFLNSKKLRLYVHREHNFNMFEPIRDSDKNGWVYQFSWYGQLVPEAPRFLGKLTFTL